MTPVSSPMLATGSLVQTHGTDREKLAAVAKQFEGIFVRQMLAAARKADFGDPLLGGQALDTFRTMQDEHFADLAAQVRRQPMPVAQALETMVQLCSAAETLHRAASSASWVREEHAGEARQVETLVGEARRDDDR